MILPLGACLLIAGLGGAAIALHSADTDPSRSKQSKGSEGSAPRYPAGASTQALKAGKVHRADASESHVDMSEITRQLPAVVGGAQDVFLGTVTDEVGSAPFPPEDEQRDTQFEVSVTETIKGSASGTVVVNQDAGLNWEGELVLSRGMPLLEVGEEYLFVTVRDTEDRVDWYLILSGLPLAQVKVADADQREQILEKYRHAVNNQIDLDAAMGFWSSLERLQDILDEIPLNQGHAGELDSKAQAIIDAIETKQRQSAGCQPLRLFAQHVNALGRSAIAPGDRDRLLEQTAANRQELKCSA